MRIARHFIAAAADQDVQIGAKMRLLHVIDVQFVPAAGRTRRLVGINAEPESRTLELELRELAEPTHSGTLIADGDGPQYSTPIAARQQRPLTAAW